MPTSSASWTCSSARWRARPSSTIAAPSAIRPSPRSSRPRARWSRPRSTSATRYQGAVRGHRHGEAGRSRSPGRGGRADQARDHRPDRSDLRQFQRQRAAGAADPRTAAQGRALTIKDLGPIPVDVGLQTETGFPHAGTIDYVAPDLDQSTGTLAVRALLENKGAVLLPGLFVRVRVPMQRDVEVHAGARARARQRSAGTLRAGRQRQERRRAASRGDRRRDRRRACGSSRAA